MKTLFILFLLAALSFFIFGGGFLKMMGAIFCGLMGVMIGVAGGIIGALTGIFGSLLGIFALGIIVPLIILAVLLGGIIFFIKALCGV